MEKLQTVYRHKPNLVARNIGNESVIVPLRNNVAEMDILYTLNETGVFIWEQVDGIKNVDQVIHALMEEFEVDEFIAREDVFELLKQMEGKIIETV